MRMPYLQMNFNCVCIYVTQKSTQFILWISPCHDSVSLQIKWTLIKKKQKWLCVRSMDILLHVDILRLNNISLYCVIWCIQSQRIPSKNVFLVDKRWWCCSYEMPQKMNAIIYSENSWSPVYTVYTKKYIALFLAYM